jgi:hypothetical protein
MYQDADGRYHEPEQPRCKIVSHDFNAKGQGVVEVLAVERGPVTPIHMLTQTAQIPKLQLSE